MPSSSDIRAGRAFVELGANDSSLQKALNKGAAGLKKLGSQVRSLGASLSAVGASVVAPLTAAAAEFGKMGAEIAKASAITGISVEEMSTLAYAAQQTGTSIEGLQSGIGKMNKLLLEAAKGNQQANTTLAELGLNFQQLNRMSPEARFKAIAGALSKVEDPGQRAAMAMKLFGKGGAELLPLLNQGAAGIEALQKQARELGLEMSGKDAADALKYTQTMKTMWDVLEHGTFTVGSIVAPIITKVAQTITAAAETATKWVKEHKQLVTTAFIVAGSILAIGAAIVTMGTIITGLGIAMGMVATAIGVVGSVLAFLLNPITLLIAAIGGVVGAFMYFSGVGTQVVNGIIGGFNKVWGAIKFVFDNTSSASEAWGAIVAEASLYAQEAWITAKGFIVGAWIGLKSFFGSLWDGIGNGFLSAWYNISNALLNMWAKTMHAWGSMTSSIADFIFDHITKTGSKLDQQNNARFAKMRDAGQITQQQYEKLTASGVGQSVNQSRQQRDKENDSALDARLADIKKEYDAKRQALEDLEAQQDKDREKQSADEKAANAKEIADAKAEAAAKRKAYEDALQAKHKASGQSLTEQAAELFKKFNDVKPPQLPSDVDGGFKNLENKGSTAGTFSAAAAGEMGGGAGPKIVQHTKRSADLLEQIAPMLKKINEIVHGAQPATFH